MNLSKHFTREEFEYSPTALRHGWKNQMGETQLANAKVLCEKVMEPIRLLVGNHLGKNSPIRITSGYRSPKVNTAIGGAATSQHLRGQAADFENDDLTEVELFDLIRKSNIPFDQLIQECGPDGWVHVSYNPDRKTQRREVLYAVRLKGGKFSYTTTPPKK